MGAVAIIFDLPLVGAQLNSDASIAFGQGGIRLCNGKRFSVLIIGISRCQNPPQCKLLGRALTENTVWPLENTAGKLDFG